jgi:hypothetical protein
MHALLIVPALVLVVIGTAPSHLRNLRFFTPVGSFAIHSNVVPVAQLLFIVAGEMLLYHSAGMSMALAINGFVLWRRTLNS